MRMFQEAEAEGLQPVLLYCGDHDPMGLHISNTLMKNFQDLSKAVGWDPDGLVIDRFGLNVNVCEPAS